jgi:Bacteriophage HK97-gp10, putative tail-component
MVMSKKTECIIENIDFKLDYKKIQDQYAVEVANKIIKKAPVDRGNYASGIGTTRINENNVVVHNKGKHYRLGHILEKGTKGIRAQRAQPHYKPNHKPDEYMKKMSAVDIIKD